jgi:hypothetical protein
MRFSLFGIKGVTLIEGYNTMLFCYTAVYGSISYNNRYEYLKENISRVDAKVVSKP